MKLLTVQNAKTSKGEKLGYLTGILYMAPHTTATKKSLCPFSTPGCRDACLYTAGRGRFTKTQEARVRKARWFAADPDSFMEALYWDIAALKRKAEREGMKLAIRLNGTTDIRWEQVMVKLHPDDTGLWWHNIMDCFPSVQFYDYTKWPRLRRALLPDNYDLTFSCAETEENQAEAERWLAHNERVAAVFERAHDGLRNFRSLERVMVYNGDNHDLTFLQPKGCILALKAKGDAKHDTTGFVIRGQ